MSSFEDPDPLGPVEDELVVPGEEVAADPLAPPPVEEVTEEAPPVEAPVFPEPAVEDLPVEGEAPPPSDPPADGERVAGPPAGDGRLESGVFPLAVYEPAEFPEDPPGGGRLQDGGEVLVPSSVEVEVLDEEFVDDFGGVGLAFRLTRSDSGPTIGTVAADVVYDGFRHAYGGNMALRLQLVRLPACVLTTPELPGCRTRTVVDTTNLFEDGILRGDLHAAPDPGPTGSSTSDVYMVETKASGPAGDFGVTPVVTNGRWDVGIGSGNFSWSEPLPSAPTPLGAGTGTGPSLSYSSQSVDGRVSSSNNQASWAGMGWELSSGWVTRQYKSCAEMGHPSWGDHCWYNENASITLNGVTSDLVMVPGESHEWRLRDDPGWRVTEEDDPNGGGQFWRVITPDGTQYYFGANDPSAAGIDSDTNSKLGARVYGAPSWAGTGCGSTSLCPAPWRWNLSHVVDTSGNVAAYVHRKERNYYYSEAVDENVYYDRDSVLDKIYFGLRVTDLADPHDEFAAYNYGNHATSRLEFVRGLRCQDLDQSCAPPESAPAEEYRDVPLDLMCFKDENDDPCAKTYPTFWSTFKLTSVAAKTRRPADGAWLITDQLKATMKFPATGDGTDPHLWLDALERVGAEEGSPSIALPTMKFDGTNRPNRVDPNVGAPVMHMHRIDGITTEIGGRVDVSYGQPNACNPADTPHPSTNKSNCFPVLLPADHDDPDGFGWFHNYVVTQTVQSGVGLPAGGGESITTSYAYSTADAEKGESEYYVRGGGAWHLDDNDASELENRQYTDWRGYQQVTVTTGSGAGATKDVYRLFRGLHGDLVEHPGGTGTKKDVTFFDDNNRELTDYNWLRGRTYQHQRFSGATEVERNRYASGIARATSTDLSNLTASRMVVQEEAEQRLYPGSSGQVVTKTHTDYDSTHGQPVRILEHGNTLEPGDERCTITDYTVATSGKHRWLVAPKRVTLRDGDSCTGSPVVAKTETRYDQHSGIDTAPTRGLPTQVSQFTSASSWIHNFSGYDSYGRLTSVTDPYEQTTTTTYSPSTGLYSSTVTENELGHDTTTHYSTDRRLPYRVVDPRGNATHADLDAFGRTISVWKPGQNYATDDASIKYAYHVSKTEATRVTTQTHLRDTSGGDPHYIHSHVYIDGLGRTRQTQQVAPGGNDNGRLVVDTRYDDEGRVTAVTGSMNMAGIAGTGLVHPNVAAIPTETRTTYDGLGRTTKTALWRQNTAVADHFTDYEYGPGWVDTQLYGGDATTSYDAYGRPDKIVEEAAGTTHYTYNARGDLTGIDNGTLDWRYNYDWLSRRTSSEDPDAGEWETTYTATGQPQKITDAEGGATWTVYDELDRAVELRKTNATGTLLASWVYDNGGREGLLVSSSSWVDGVEVYKIGNYTYDNRSQLTGRTYTIHADAPGDTAGTYTYGYTYDEAGNRTSTTYPAAGGLPAETVTQGYSVRGYETHVTGDRTYLSSTTYSDDGLLVGRAHGGTGNLTRSYAYHPATRLLKNITTTHELVEDVPTTIQDTDFTWNARRSLTGIHTAGPHSLNECFRYDGANRLTSAVTRTGNACQGPRAAETDPGAYDIRYQYGPTGNILDQVNGYDVKGRFIDHTYDGHAVQTISATQYVEDDDGPHYPPPPDSIPGPGITGTPPGDDQNTDTTWDETGAGGVDVDVDPIPDWTRVTDTFTYDDNGQMLTHANDPVGEDIDDPDGDPAGPTTTYTWTPRHKLNTVKIGTGGSAPLTSYAYDADNNRILRNENGTITLYLDGTEITTDNTGNNPKAKRYYATSKGVTVGIRTPDGPWYRTLQNHQGSTQYIIQNNHATAELIEYDPWGTTRNTSPSTPEALPTDNRYLNAPHDDLAGLVYLRARTYDSRLSAFLSPDPILDKTNPQTLNPYRYSLNNPSTYTDPSGLAVDDGCGGCTIPRPPPGGGGESGSGSEPNWFEDLKTGTQAAVETILSKVEPTVMFVATWAITKLPFFPTAYSRAKWLATLLEFNGNVIGKLAPYLRFAGPVGLAGSVIWDSISGWNDNPDAGTAERLLGSVGRAVGRALPVAAGGYGGALAGTICGPFVLVCAPAFAAGGAIVGSRYSDQVGDWVGGHGETLGRWIDTSVTPGAEIVLDRAADNSWRALIRIASDPAPFVGAVASSGLFW